MTDVQMILGDFQFKITTAEFRSLERRHDQNKAVLKRVGTQSATQHIGADVGVIKMNGTVLPHWNGGWGQMDRLRAMANDGDALELIDGFGKSWGPWDITSVVETGSEYFNGAPLKIEFGVTLQEYGGDRGRGVDLLALGASLLARLI